MMNLMKACGHDYEELGSGRYVTAGSMKYDYAEEKGGHLAPINGQMATSNFSVSTLSGSEMSRPTHRRRQNPLYDDFDERDELVKNVGKDSGSSRCCHLLVTAVCILCIATSVVMALMLTGLLTPMTKPQERTELPETAALRSSHNSTETKLAKALIRISDLETKHENLIKQFQEMQSFYKNQLQLMQQNISSQSQRVEQLGTDLSQENAQLHSQITAANASLHSQLQNVAKMEGPRGPRGFNGSQGPPGAGDLSKCKDIQVTAGAKAPMVLGTWTPTANQVSVTDIQDWVVLGAECSGQNVREHKLDTKIENGRKMYRCICTSISSTNTAYCIISVWLCPVTS